jgi:hypothetical protein
MSSPINRRRALKAVGMIGLVYSTGGGNPALLSLTESGDG